jgi:nucleotide-binding universal stress UspA family protein
MVMYENHKWIIMVVSHILVPYDGQRDAERAFDEAVKICKKHPCVISLVTCFDESSNGTGFALRELPTHFTHIITKKIKILEERAKNESISFSHYFIKSKLIVQELVSFASKNNVDMIIVGSSNPGDLKKLFLGSVSEELQKNANCIVKIVK